MGSLPDLFARLYVPRRPLTVEWLSEITRRLKRQGIEFGGISSYVPNPDISDQSSFEAILALLSQIGYGAIDAYGKHLGMTLSFETDWVGQRKVAEEIGDEEQREYLVRLAQRAFGVVYLIIDSVYVNPDRELLPYHADYPMGAYVIPAYQQPYLALLHWLEVLGEELGAAFGFAMGSDTYMPDEWDYPSEIDEGVDVALRAGRLPDLRQWIEGAVPQYVAADRLAQETILRWLETPGQGVKRLASGACLLDAPFAPVYPDARTPGAPEGW